MQIRKKTDLSSVIFAGGLSLERVDFLVEGLSNRKANKLRMILTSHIGQPVSNELPENIDAIIKPYTKKEAEQWITEYEKAMSEFPADDS